MIFNPETSAFEAETLQMCARQSEGIGFESWDDPGPPRWAGGGPGVCAYLGTLVSPPSWSRTAMTHRRGAQLTPPGMQVDMTWSGHVHLYERTCPILFHECLGYSPEGIPNAPVHMSIGNGGVRIPCHSSLLWRVSALSAHPCSRYNRLSTCDGGMAQASSGMRPHICYASCETSQYL